MQLLRGIFIKGLAKALELYIANKSRDVTIQEVTFLDGKWKRRFLVGHVERNPLLACRRGSEISLDLLSLTVEDQLPAVLRRN